MAHQERTVDRNEASRILVALKAVLRESHGPRSVYWSKSNGAWVTVEKVSGDRFKISWDGKKDCKC